MTTKPNDGGPAFPVAIMARQADGQPMTGYDFGVQGMTLRDYFAAKAMQGMLACPLNINGVSAHEEGYSRAAYIIADAMLAEREKGQQSGENVDT